MGPPLSEDLEFWTVVFIFSKVEPRIPIAMSHHGYSSQNALGNKPIDNTCKTTKPRFWIGSALYFAWQLLFLETSDW